MSLDLCSGLLFGRPKLAFAFPCRILFQLCSLFAKSLVPQHKKLKQIAPKTKNDAKTFLIDLYENQN